MNWYERFKTILAQVRGEWWIDESGSAVFADGDIGDVNHEGYVIQSIQSQFADPQFEIGEGVDWEGYKRFLASNAIQEAYADQSKAQALLKQMNLQDLSQISTVDMEELAQSLLLQRGMTPEQIEIAEGRGDIRLYAMQHLGWKRVQDSNVETFSITPNDMKIIADGLWDAYHEESEEAVFNIYVFGNKKWYNNVPFAVISDENPMALRDYAYMGRIE